MRYAISTLVISVILCSCANNRAGKISSQVSRIETEISDLRDIQSEHTIAIEAVRDEIRQLLGRIERLEFGERQVTGLRDDINAIRSRVPPPAIVPVRELESDESMISQLPYEEAQLFKNALEKIRNGGFTQSISLLRELQGRSHGASWGAQVSFWIGVSYDGLGAPRDALRFYHEAAVDYPKSERAPLALLREGSVFIRLGDNRSAELAFKKLISDYPRSQEAGVAKQRLRDLGK